jgi:hypothetical protein
MPQFPKNGETAAFLDLPASRRSYSKKEFKEAAAARTALDRFRKALISNGKTVLNLIGSAVKISGFSRRAMKPQRGSGTCSFWGSTHEAHQEPFIGIDSDCYRCQWRLCR